MEWILYIINVICCIIITAYFVVALISNTNDIFAWIMVLLFWWGLLLYDIIDSIDYYYNINTEYPWIVWILMNVPYSLWVILFALYLIRK